MSPRSARASRTLFDVLVHVAIDIPAKALWVDPWCTLERGHKDLGRDELPSDRLELTDGNAIPRHDEALAAIERPHDLSALVSQLTLRDPSCHSEQCRTRATSLGGVVLLTSSRQTFALARGTRGVRPPLRSTSNMVAICTTKLTATEAKAKILSRRSAGRGPDTWAQTPLQTVAS